jgi:peroxin-19
LEKEKVQPAATSDIGSSNDEEVLFREGMQRLLQCSSEMANASDQNSLFSALEKMSASDPGMNEFMNAMMSTVLSKDFMYPPLQSLLEKFGPYLEENKEKLSEEDLSKYQHQQEVIEKRQLTCTK